MAEETKAQEPQAEERPQEETDWKAKYEAMRQHSREWEKKAKDNQAAADELEKLRAAQMTEQEKAVARAEAAEKELVELRAEAQRQADIRDVAQKTGVPESLLMYCTDRGAMEAFAAEYEKNKAPIHSAPAAAPSRIVNGTGPKRANRDIFAEFAASQLNR